MYKSWIWTSGKCAETIDIINKMQNSKPSKPETVTSNAVADPNLELTTSSKSFGHPALQTIDAQKLVEVPNPILTLGINENSDVSDTVSVQKFFDNLKLLLSINQNWEVIDKWPYLIMIDWSNNKWKVKFRIWIQPLSTRYTTTTKTHSKICWSANYRCRIALTTVNCRKYSSQNWT